MPSMEELFVILTADTANFKKGMTEAEASAAGLRAENDKMLASVGKFALGVGVAAVTAGAGLAKMAGDFQSLTTQLVTGAGESVKNIDMIRKGLLSMAGEVGSTPDELAKGLYNIESAGFHAQQALDILRISAEGAKVGQADQATVADALTTALNAYHLSATDAAAVTNDLITTVSLGKTHMQDLASSMGSILPVASALGVPLDEITAAMATMTVQGTDASKSATSLRFLLSALAGPTSAAAKEMEGLGIGMQEIPGITQSVQDELQTLGLHTSEVASVLAGPNGLQNALKMITDAIGKQFPVGSAQYEAALKAAVGGTRGMTAALELTGQSAAVFASNVDTIDSKVKGAGGSVAGWTLVQEDFNTKLDQAKGSMAALAITAGTALLPAFSTVATFVGDVASDLQGLTTATSQTDGPARDFANILKDVGGFLSNDVLPPLKTFGQWMLDHKQVAEDIGLAVASWWAVDKISGWTSQAVTAFTKVFGGLAGLFGGGSSGGAGGALNSVTGMRVFVTNWEMMPGSAGGLGGIGGRGAVSAEEGLAGAGLTASLLTGAGELIAVSAATYFASQAILSIPGAKGAVAGAGMTAVATDPAFFGPGGTTNTTDNQTILRNVASIAGMTGQLNDTFKEWYATTHPIPAAAQHIGEALNNTPVDPVKQDFDNINSKSTDMYTYTQLMSNNLQPAVANTALIQSHTGDAAQNAGLVNTAFWNIMSDGGKVDTAFGVILSHLGWVDAGAAHVGQYLNTWTPYLPGGGSRGGTSGFGINTPGFPTLPTTPPTVPSALPSGFGGVVPYGEGGGGHAPVHVHGDVNIHLEPASAAVAQQIRDELLNLSRGSGASLFS